MGGGVACAARGGRPGLGRLLGPRQGPGGWLEVQRANRAIAPPNWTRAWNQP